MGGLMASKKAVIRIDRNWAALAGASIERVRDVLSAPDPEVQKTLASQEGRVDGTTCLARGSSFPSGLVSVVAEELRSNGWDVTIKRRKLPRWNDQCYDLNKLRLTKNKKEYKLWPHVLEAVRACLSTNMGCVKSPTSSGKTSMLGAIAYAQVANGRTVGIIVPKRGLLHQTAKTVSDMLKPFGMTVGRFGDGKAEDADVVVTTIQSFSRWKGHTRNTKNGKQRVKADPFARHLKNDRDVWLVDEVHHVGATSWYDTLLSTTSYTAIYGFSGTPISKDKLRDLKLTAVCGPVIHRVSDEVLLELDLVSRVKVCLVSAESASGPPLGKVLRSWRSVTGKRHVVHQSVNYKQAYDEGIVRNLHHNTAVVRSILWCVSQERQTLVLTRRKEHFTTLKNMLDEAGVSCSAIWGDHKTDERILAVR